MLTPSALDEYVFGALDAGASGFLLKGGEPADLVRAIQIVAAGDSLLAPSVTRHLIDSYVSRPQPHAQTDHDGVAELIAREREVLGRIATGLNNAQIAEALQLMPANNQDTRVEDPDEARGRDRVQLVIIAYQTGIARP